MKLQTKSLLATMIALGGVAPAQASLLFTLQQVGSDVVASASGSVNTAGLTNSNPINNRGDLWASDGYLSVGTSLLTQVAQWSGFSGPTSFGPGANFAASSGSGTPIGIIGAFSHIYLPIGYVSGNSLSAATATWSGTTFAGLGVTPGTYDWTWGTGGDADSARLVIGDAPEPATLALLAAGLAGLARARRRRRGTV